MFLALLPLTATAGCSVYCRHTETSVEILLHHRHSELVWDACQLVPPEPRFQLPSVVVGLRSYANGRGGLMASNGTLVLRRDALV